MKLIKGRTLSALLNERPDEGHELARFIHAFEQICQTIGYAHRQGVIHRDLKPLNVMVGAFAEVQVMDWGLAKELHTAEHQRWEERTSESLDDSLPPDERTQAGSIMGTPAFMSPEQARGEVENLGPATDVFSLGAMLCLILTGKPPFPGSTSLEVLRAAASADLKSTLAALDSCGADREIIAVAKRCLAAERSNRPADGEALAKLVADYRAGVEARLREAQAERAASLAKTQERRKRRNVQYALAGVTILLLGLAGFGIWWSKHVESARVRLAAETRGRAEEATESAIVAVRGLMERALWIDAEGTIDQALAALGTDDSNVDLRGRLESVRREVRLTSLLDQIQFDRGANYKLEGTNVINTGPEANARTESALREFGWDVREPDVEGLVERIKASPIRPYVLAALDAWMFSEPNLALRIRLWGLTTGIGKESWRGKLMTHWTTASLVRDLIVATPADQRTPALYHFAGDRMRALEADALPTFAEGCRRYPNDFNLNFLYAVESTRKSKFEEAVGAYRTALVIRPGSSEVWAQLSTCYRRKGDVPSALDCARTAVRHQPGSRFAQSALGWAAYQSEDYQTAEASFRKAISLSPGTPFLHRGLAWALDKQDRLPEAIVALREEVRIGNKAVDIEQLGQIQFRLGNYDASIAEYEAYSKLAPASAVPHYAISLAHACKGEQKAAAAAMETANRLDSDAASKLGATWADILAADLQAKLDGRRPFRTADELLVYARTLAYHGQKFRAVVDLHRAALSQHPEWIDWPAEPPLYLAAICASRAATGLGDAAGLSPAEREAMKSQALIWLSGCVAQAEAEKKKAPAAEDPEITAPLRTIPAGPLTLLSDRMPKHASPAITGWRNQGLDNPSVAANSSDKTELLPGIVRPHSIVVHPLPHEYVAAVWSSPIDGKVRIAATIEHVHADCGNGIAYRIEHRQGKRVDVLAEDTVELGNRVKTPPMTVRVQKGDLLLLVVDARDGNHSCDLTEITLTIDDAGQAGRRWDLAKDVADTIVEGNPHADSLGNKEVWRFVRGASVPGLSPKNGLVARHIDWAGLMLTNDGLATLREPNSLLAMPWHQQARWLSLWRRFGAVAPTKFWTAYLTRLGSADTVRADWARASTFFREATRLEPANPGGYIYLGYSLMNNREHDAAVVALRQAIQLDPQNAIARLNLGFAYHLQGKVVLALRECEEASRLNPNSELIRNYTTLVRKAKADYDAGIIPAPRLVAP